MVIAVVTFGILVTCLYVLTGVWLEKHGEARRWRVWLMDTIFCAIVMGAIFTLLQPFDLLVVGLGFILGAVVGAILGLFDRKRFPSARPNRRRMDN